MVSVKQYAVIRIDLDTGESKVVRISNYTRNEVQRKINSLQRLADKTDANWVYMFKEVM